jgi:hypothetical protein
LEQTGSGRHFDGGEVEQMTNYLIQLIDGEHRCSFIETEIAAYSRQQQAEQVLGLLGRMLLCFFMIVGVKSPC